MRPNLCGLFVALSELTLMLAAENGTKVSKSFTEAHKKYWAFQPV